MQPPLLSLALGPCKGSFEYVNAGLFIAGAPLFILPFLLDCYLRKPVATLASPLQQRLLHRGRNKPEVAQAPTLEMPDVQ